jgi:flavin-dependent dehydrogenase
MQTFDVAVVGGGPAGSATARLLAQRGCRVALIERTRFTLPRVGESLPPAVQPLLVQLGVWQDFLALQPLPSYGTRSLWGSAEPEIHSHLTSRWGCGWHVDRLAFDRMLAQAAQKAGAVLRCGTPVGRCSLEAEGWTVELREHCKNDSARRFSKLRASVLIDATGRGCHLARSLAAQPLLFDHLVGIAMRFDHDHISDEGYVMVEAVPEGWWYSAPLPSGDLMLMLMTDSDLCRRAELASRSAWMAGLRRTRASHARVKGAPSMRKPAVFCAISQRLRRADSKLPWLAVGDASLAVDPISGSGVIRGLRSARAGAETALVLLNGGESDPIGEYESGRDRDCTEFLYERALYYGLECRWRESDFWARRVAAGARVAMF